jgi:hypothetical protein
LPTGGSQRFAGLPFINPRKEIVMNVSKLIALLVVPLCVGSAALAQEDSPAGLSRAEVLADLQIWRDSGMAAVHAGEDPAWFNRGYDAAAARYAAMRASPAFAALVDRIAQQRGEKVKIASAK